MQRTDALAPPRLGDGRPRRQNLLEADDEFESSEDLAYGDGAIRRRPAVFTEKGFYDYVTQLVNAGRYETAARYFVEMLPELAASKINLKEKFNHLIYLPRLIQAGSGTKHGYHKLLRKAKSVEASIAGLDLPGGGGFVELGCGAHDPVSLASYFFLNGFAPCLAVDLLPPRTETYSALSMYDILANVKMFPGRYARPGTLPKDILLRLREFSASAFERGDFTGGLSRLNGRVRFEAKDIVDCEIEENSISLLVSFAVLEHVSDIESICRYLYRIMKPGGIVFHFVDLADHRAYRGDKAYGPLSFLTEQTVAPNFNRLRAPEITEMHGAAGFEVLRDQRKSVPVSAEIEAKLLPQWKLMPLDEVAVIKQQLTLRKPSG